MPNKSLFPDPDLKQLLQDLEATGFDIDAVDIQKVLRGNETFYGIKNSDRYLKFARKFYQLRRNSFKSYGRFFWNEDVHDKLF